MNITLTFSDIDAITIAKLERLAKSAGKDFKVFVAEFLAAQLTKVVSSGAKGI